MNRLKFFGQNVLTINLVIPLIIGFYQSTNFNSIDHSMRKRFSFFSCIESRVTIRENRPDSIVFYVDDTATSRVEFILRRCHGVRINKIYFY